MKIKLDSGKLFDLSLTNDEVRQIERFVEGTMHYSHAARSHGPLDIPKLVSMLLEDVALMMTRPGSWEGANMQQVMCSHGYPP